MLELDLEKGKGCWNVMLTTMEKRGLKLYDIYSNIKPIAISSDCVFIIVALVLYFDALRTVSNENSRGVEFNTLRHPTPTPTYFTLLVVSFFLFYVNN